MMLAVIIPVFGQIHYTHALLRDIKTQNKNVEVFIIDNGGDYESLGFEWVTKAESNLGWLKACNLGLSSVSDYYHFDAYILLNVFRRHTSRTDSYGASMRASSPLI